MSGCLGAARRRRTRIAAISPGEPPTGPDPGISEWGNPTAWNGCRHAGEHIAGWRHTLGSEPSKYQQEEKSNEIPTVAASEVGGAQTAGGDAGGVVGRTARLEKAGGQPNGLGRPARQGEGPVGEVRRTTECVPEYVGTRGILTEAGGTTLQG